MIWIFLVSLAIFYCYFCEQRLFPGQKLFCGQVYCVVISSIFWFYCVELRHTALFCTVLMSDGGQTHRLPRQRAVPQPGVQHGGHGAQ